MSNNCRIDIDIQTRDNNKTNELMERIHQMECREAVILREAHELREQNELLEFRIIELEEGCDKVSWKIDFSLSPFLLSYFGWPCEVHQYINNLTKFVFCSEYFYQRGRLPESEEKKFRRISAYCKHIHIPFVQLGAILCVLSSTKSGEIASQTIRSHQNKIRKILSNEFMGSCMLNSKLLLFWFPLEIIQVM